MNLIQKRSAILVCVVLTASAVWAGSRSAVDVDDCVVIALQNNPKLKVIQEEQKQSYAEYRIAKAPRNLIVNGEMKTVEYLKPDASSNSAFNLPGKDTDIGLFAGLTANYSLYNAKATRQEEAAKFNLDTARFVTLKKKNTLILEVQTAFFSYLMTREIAEKRREIMDNEKRKLALTQRFMREGQTPVLAVTRAQVNYVEALYEAEKAANSESELYNGLLHSMGIETISDDIDFVTDAMARDIAYSVDELIALSRHYNPEYRILEIKKRVSRMSIDVEKSSSIPRVDLVFAMGYENKALQGIEGFGENFYAANWSPTFQGLVRASMPVYSGGAIEAKIDNARSEYNKISYQQKELSLAVQTTIKNLTRRHEELQRQVELSGLVIENARKHLLLAEKTYQSGQASQVDIVDARVALIRAEIARITARYTSRIILAQLANTVGIDEDELCVQ